MNVYRVALVLLLSFCYYNIVAQNLPVHITGTIRDTSGNEIQNSYVKITNLRTSTILTYFNTGKSSAFYTNVYINNPDSISVIVTNISYNSFRQTFLISNGDSIKNSIVLLPKEHTLENVIVNAPPMWVRGDTTFFKANHFKEGDEKSLKDIILKMPGFEIDDNDNLLYKRKRVEKIFIDGEDLFAEKVRLLLNNFPLHVINVIQALENQNDNKILKGLKNDNKVFLNISLSKEKVLHAFGSGELGLGTADRYLIKPVIFSIYNKIKLGYIGSFSSMGDGLTVREDQEIKLEESAELEPWQVRAQGLITIGNFQNSRYITNQRFNNNFQINLPSGKKFKNRVLATVLTDRQSQQSFYNSSIYSDSVYINRNDSNKIVYKPMIVSLSEILEWQKNDRSLLKTNLRIYKDFSNNHQSSIYSQSGQKDYSNTNIKNDWLAVAAQLEYSKRVSVNEGYKITGLVNHNNYTQLAESQSSAWPSVFNVAAGYDKLLQLPDIKNTNVAIGWEMDIKKKSHLHQINLYGKWQQFDFNRSLYFNSSTNNLPDTTLPSYTDKGLYNIFTLNSEYQYSKKIGSFFLRFKPSIGYIKTLIKENNKAGSSFQYPIYNISALLKKSISYKLQTTLLSSIEQRATEKYQFSNFLLPQSAINFKRSLQSNRPITNIAGTASLYYAWKMNKSTNSSSLSIGFNRSYRNSVLKNALINIVQLSIDSFANIPLNQFSIYSSSSLNDIKTGIIYTVGGGLNLNQGLLSINEIIVKSNITFAYFYLTGKKNWDKKYFAEFKYFQFYSKISYPLNLNAINNYVPSMRLQLMQRVFLFKKINFIVNTEYFNGNLNAKNNASLFFIDAEANINLSKSKLQLSVIAANLINKNNYYSNNNTLISQSLFQLPIIKRNISFSVKYNL